jgi:uncharacterized protein YeaO (DUF488 family)
VPLKTKRWNDPIEPDDGFRLLVTRYRPRGVSKEDEAWDDWQPKLGPSTKLHAAVYAENHSPVPWPLYRRSYLAEQRANAELIDALAKRVAAGETITLLCSTACTRESRCHRSLLRELIETRLDAQADTPAADD